MTIPAIIIIVGFFFLLVFLSGLWLSRTGRPLNAAISAAHKLISLGAGIFLLVIIYQRSQVAPLGGAEWLATAVTGLSFQATVASGGLLSSEEPRPGVVLKIHQIVPVLTVILSAVTLYLVLGPWRTV